MFTRLRSGDNSNNREPESIKLAALALSRLSSRFDPKNNNSNLYIEELEKFDNFEYVMNKIKEMIKNDLVLDEAAEENQKMILPPKKENQDDERKVAKDTLKYMLNVLENVTSEERTREKLDCSKIFEHVIDAQVFSDKLEVESKMSLIRIMFNLNFNLNEPHILKVNFL